MLSYSMHADRDLMFTECCKSECYFLVPRSIFSSIDISWYTLDVQGLHHIPLELFGVDFLAHLLSDTVSSVAQDFLCSTCFNHSQGSPSSSRSIP